MLEDSYKLFLDNASLIPNFVPGTKKEHDDVDVLANGYCNAELHQDTNLMGAYISALMIRYWYMIPYLYQESKSLRIEKEDVIDILYDAFLKAFKNKKWLVDGDKLQKDTHGAQKVIERCIDSVRNTQYQLANYDVRKINYISHSLDYVQEVYGDSSEEFSVEDKQQDLIDINSIIHASLKQNNVLKAILIDCICFQDSQMRNGNLSTSKIVSSIDMNYVKYFMKTYGINNINVEELIKLLRMPRKKLLYNIKKELLLLSNDEVIKDLYVARCSESK